MIVVSLSKLRIGITEHFGDSEAGKCVISLEKYNKIPSKFKTELFKSHIKIKAANGYSIENSGECDITFKIGKSILILMAAAAYSIPHISCKGQGTSILGL